MTSAGSSDASTSHIGAAIKNQERWRRDSSRLRNERLVYRIEACAKVVGVESFKDYVTPTLSSITGYTLNSSISTHMVATTFLIAHF